MSNKPESDDNIDYRIEQKSQEYDTDRKTSFVQFFAYGLLITILIISFVIIFNLNVEISSLRNQNAGLQTATGEVSSLKKMNSELRATIRGQTASLYPDTAKRLLTLNGRSVICVQGTWNENNEWENTADTTTLLWPSGSAYQTISQSGLKLSCDALLQLIKPRPLKK